jgi:uncharacterized membrane protein (DUF106 family)
MAGQMLTIVSSVLAMIIGLWKFFTGKERKRQKEIDEEQKKFKKAVKSGNRGPMLRSALKLRQLRKK